MRIGCPLSLPELALAAVATIPRALVPLLVSPGDRIGHRSYLRIAGDSYELLVGWLTDGEIHGKDVEAAAADADRNVAGPRTMRSGETIGAIERMPTRRTPTFRHGLTVRGATQSQSPVLRTLRPKHLVHRDIEIMFTGISRLDPARELQLLPNARRYLSIVDQGRPSNDDLGADRRKHEIEGAPGDGHLRHAGASALIPQFRNGGGQS